MQKIEVVVKEELFEALGLSIGRCSARTDNKDSYVRITGDIYCNRTWEEGYELKMKANLIDNSSDIVHVDYDLDRKNFFKVSYESFSINCYKTIEDSDIKCVEVYPKVEKVTNEYDD